MKEIINEILSSEKVLKKSEHRAGYMYLTTNHLIWLGKKWKIGKTAVIPLCSIKEVGLKRNFGGVWFLKVTLNDFVEEKLFAMADSPTRVYEWVSTLGGLNVGKTDSIRAIIEDITYAGGYSGSSEECFGRLMFKEEELVFEGRKYKHVISIGANQNLKRYDFELRIPYQKIENLSIKTTSEINRLRTVLAGPLWSMGLPDKNEFVLVEYIDEVGMKQTPLFNSDKTTKGAIMNILYEKIKKHKMDKTETQLVQEDPMVILKLRYVKGEISKEEYAEMKKVLEE